MSSTIQKTILDNGLTVISEFIPSVRSVSVGAWVRVGSRYENHELNGIAHFLEHMVFKGTKKRSALKIAEALEDLGGSLNAYTSKELTVYYAHSLDSHLGVSINVLADLLCNPLLREKDLVKEKQVVLEEISSVKDTPDEYIVDLFQEKLFPDQAIGFPILGTGKSVSAFSFQNLSEFWEKFYCPDNIIVCAAGNIDHEHFIKLCTRQFHFTRRYQPVELALPIAARNIDLIFKEPVNQMHICAGLEGLSYMSESRYQLIALNTYLGGGMSSRLFQVIREKHGLAYSVYSFIDFFRDTGIFSFYIGTDKRNHKKALSLLFQEIDKLTQKPISDHAVHKIREQLKGSFLLALESTYRRMTRLAKNEIYYQRQISIDELVERINEITPESLLNIARQIFGAGKFNIIRLFPQSQA
jgi:predicted Zn-dependent peptidase